jgi:hypothetical protein
MARPKLEPGTPRFSGPLAGPWFATNGLQTRRFAEPVRRTHACGLAHFRAGLGLRRAREVPIDRGYRLPRVRSQAHVAGACRHVRCRLAQARTVRRASDAGRRLIASLQTLGSKSTSPGHSTAPFSGLIPCLLEEPGARSAAMSATGSALAGGLAWPCLAAVADAVDFAVKALARLAAGNRRQQRDDQ